MVNMDRHKCKLCSRRFSSGRALGGHMRSHLATLPLPPKTPQKQKQKEVNYSDFVAVGTNNGGGGGGDAGGGGTTETYTESTSSECFEEEQRDKADDTESEVEKGLVYGLRENPKKSFRLVDPEFLDDDSVVQDRESETESTRKPTRRRSKRTRRMLAAKVVDHVVVVDDDDDDVVVKKVQDMINNKPSSTESLVVELEPVSSVSDTSPEEDLALCLIMLSRDVWSSSTTFSDNSEVLKLSQTQNTKFKFRCEICDRVFASSQALGSHRTSHMNKKMKMNFPPSEDNNNNNEGESKQRQQFIKSNNNGVIKNAEKKVHECPFCGKVFGSGQALGGHKRSHLMSSSTTTTPSSSSKPGDSLVDSNSAKIQEALMIDLNLPAPMEEEEEEQNGGFFCLQEVSAISDAVFINPINH